MRPDILYDAALRLTVKHGKGSTAVLRDGLGIDYARAVNLIDLMENAGVLAPAQDSGPRSLVNRTKLQKLVGRRA